MAKVISLEKELEMWSKFEAVQDTFPYTEQGFVDFSNYCANKLYKGLPASL